MDIPNLLEIILTYHTININLKEALRFLRTTGIGPFTCKEIRVSLFHRSGSQWVKEDITCQPLRFTDKQCQVTVCRKNFFSMLQMN